MARSLPAPAPAGPLARSPRRLRAVSRKTGPGGRLLAALPQLGRALTARPPLPHASRRRRAANPLRPPATVGKRVHPGGAPASGRARLPGTGAPFGPTLLLAALLAPPAQAQFIAALATFGDNVADPGNIPGYLEAGNAAGQGPFDTNFPPSPPYFGNRFSNGPVAVEYLADLLRVPASTTTHLAVGNAFSAPLPVILTGGTVVGNGSAIPAPVGRELTPLNETDVASQVGQYLAARPTLARDDLMVVYASANDGALALNTVAALGLGGAEAANLIRDGAVTNAVNTAAAVRRLIDAGAAQLVVVLLPDIGQTPAATAGGLAGSGAGSLFSQVTNEALRAEAAGLNGETAAVVSVFDSFTLLTDIVANPAKYGLENVTLPCLAVTACVSDPAGAERFLFWDEFFPTTAVHAITAAALADTVNAPKTLAGQAEVARLAGMQFAERLLRDGDHGGLFVSYDRSEWERDGETFAFGYDADVDRLTLGGRLSTDGGWRLAAALALGDGSVSYRGVQAGFDLESLSLAVSAGRDIGAFALDAVASFSDDELEDVRRETGVAGQVARGASAGETLTFLAQLALPLERGAWRITPQLRLGHGEAELDGYRETGAVALEQAVDRRTSESTFAELGLRVAGAAAGARWRPTAGLAWHHDLSDDDQRIASRLVTAPGVTRFLRVGVPDDAYLRADVALARHLTQRFRLRIGAEVITGADRLDGWRAGLTLAYRW